MPQSSAHRRSASCIRLVVLALQEHADEGTLARIICPSSGRSPRCPRSPPCSRRRLQASCASRQIGGPCVATPRRRTRHPHAPEVLRDQEVLHRRRRHRALVATDLHKLRRALGVIQCGHPPFRSLLRDDRVPGSTCLRHPLRLCVLKLQASRGERSIAQSLLTSKMSRVDL